MRYKPLCVIQSGEKQIANFSWNDNSPWFPTKLESQANAAFIVKAVNSHDNLVKALTDLCDEIGAHEEHGDGADDAGCQVCRSHKRARKLLKEVQP